MLLTPIEEIPPRARRRAFRAPGDTGASGNTSACAEKSYGSEGWGFESLKYLRVRGEESIVRSSSQLEKEIPPRARRRGPRMSSSLSISGNTSACAEKRLHELDV